MFTRIFAKARQYRRSARKPSPWTSARPSVERLSERIAPAANVVAVWSMNTLTVIGTSGNDIIRIGVDGSNRIQVYADQQLVTIGGRPIAGATVGNTARINVFGGAGNDFINVSMAGRTAWSKPTTLNGGVGNDRIVGGSGADTINGGPGKNILYGMGGNDALNGGSDTDHLDGGAGNDTLNGGVGNDSFVFSSEVAPGSDTILDSAGTDKLDFSLMTLDLSIDLSNTGVQTVNSDLSFTLTLPAGIENVTGGFGNDHLTGNSSANVLTGGAGDDVLAGGAGNDTYMLDTDNDFGSDTITEAANEGANDTLDITTSDTFTVDKSLTTLQQLTEVVAITFTNSNEVETVLINGA